MMHHTGGIRHDSQTIIPTQRSNCKAQLRSFLPLQQLSSLGTPGRGKGGTAEGDQRPQRGLQADLAVTLLSLASALTLTDGAHQHVPVWFCRARLTVLAALADKTALAC
ncbi:hypothetical protein T069G_02323 [Trichoderma breve]|uniref:Uncharacterized protein n=1 Tax=Trichoderma breve TaxID=2034170 RepID=A0A9W9BHB9_9HYPO|nr:hypothetical protein T069G_02323 [Trichoderma breve]KAJ4861369.1 hypothetical protein T069G_02323 [Trichoderma breve]